MAHWIIEDQEFGGKIYRCSKCRNAWNDLYYDDILKDKCPACGEFISEDADEYIEEIKKTKWQRDSVISISSLISWLNDQKYTNVEETSDNMTEEFEKEHQWELSRNCFINKMIKQLEELK